MTSSSFLTRISWLSVRMQSFLSQLPELLYDLWPQEKWNAGGPLTSETDTRPLLVWRHRWFSSNSPGGKTTCGERHKDVMCVVEKGVWCTKAWTQLGEHDDLRWAHETWVRSHRSAGSLWPSLCWLLFLLSCWQHSFMEILPTFQGPTTSQQIQTRQELRTCSQTGL